MSEDSEIQVFKDLRIKLKKKDQEIKDLKEEREYWKARASFLGWELYRLGGAQKKENTDSESNNYKGDKLVVGKNTQQKRQTNYDVDGERNKVEAKRRQDNIDGDRKRTKAETKRNHDNYDGNGEKSKVVAKISRDNDGDRESSTVVAKRRYDDYEDNRKGAKVGAESCNRKRTKVETKINHDNNDSNREKSKVVAKISRDNDGDRESSTLVAKRRYDDYEDNRKGTKVGAESSSTVMLGNENSDNSRGQVDESFCNETNMINRRYSAVYRERISAVEKTDYIDTEHNSEIEEDCPYQLWKCLICPKTFRFAAGLAIHLEAHYPGNRPVISCPMNDQFSGTVEKMTEHLRSKHTEERLFPCSKCTVKLATIGALRQHEIKHQRSHIWKKCSNCPAFFNRVVGKCRFCKTSE